MAKLYFGCDGRSFRFGRGSQKFSQSWDRQKMEERERARDRARAAKLYKRKVESDKRLANMGWLA